MTYDGYGNILTKNGISYGYDGTWKDKLISYNGYSITYDRNGNPTNYLGTSATWEKGRQLKQYGANTYKYNNEGIRIQKTTSSEIHEYILDGTNIVKEIVTDICNCPKYTNEYFYDLDGTVCGLEYNGTAYYFYKNLQGDVIAITDDAGATVARYAYDAWGKCTIASDISGVNIATVNPFRYRSYYYDTETELYYLQSRYYDPVVGRFLNSDDVTLGSIIDSVLQSNLFVYCRNNPINEVDQNGTLPGIGILIKKILKGLAIGFFSVFFIDLIEYAFSVIVLKRTNAEFQMSKGEDYAAAMLNEIVAQFCDIDEVKDAMAFIAIVTKYLTKFARRRMEGQDWLNLLLELVELFLNNKLKKIKKNLEFKRQQIIVQKKKKGSRNLIRKSQIQAQTRLTLKIRYKGIQIDFVLPLSFKFISSVLNIFVFA